jgi:hypothetical protein
VRGHLHRCATGVVDTCAEVFYGGRVRFHRYCTYKSDATSVVVRWERGEGVLKGKRSVQDTEVGDSWLPHRMASWGTTQP